MVLVVVVLSLVPPPPMDMPKHGDKFEHLLAYAVLAAVAGQVWRPGRPHGRRGVRGGHSGLRPPGPPTRLSAPPRRATRRSP